MYLHKRKREFMLKSMTGFGRSEISTQEHKIVVEIKAVNHRYCDIAVKMTKKLCSFETAIRNLLKQYIGRGKIDIYISYDDNTESNINVKFNEGIAREYLNGLNQLSEDLHIKNDITVSSLAKYPDIFTLDEKVMDEETVWTLLERAITEAAQMLVETRATEGSHLKKDINEKLDGILEYITYIEKRSPRIVAEYRAKLKAKVQDLLGDTQIDEGVLATEITVFADKMCVDEETVRLKSHIQNMKTTLDDSVNVGRKLDFIAQEMNREANTILSKASDLQLSNNAIDLKTDIEKIREQIQNIE